MGLVQTPKHALGVTRFFYPSTEFLHFFHATAHNNKLFLISTSGIKATLTRHPRRTVVSRNYDEAGVML
jgi:hypothetical protein